MSGPDISLSNLLQDANLPASIAQDPWFHVTFLSKYLKRLWRKHHYSDTAPFHCICSENPCFIQELMIALNISKDEDMRLFSQRMDSSLKSMLKPSKKLTKSSGRIKKKLRSQKKSENGEILPSDSSGRLEENGNIPK